ncbi:abortive infection family protein [Nioella ostreopsis]|uniref:abortive infection family protein n=1 Tax=Nioella ostreopsis TaxID=2448479 RepID=UPI000FD6D0EA|nr:abortive infection family protein [Nioella ostreopsis]
MNGFLTDPEIPDDPLEVAIQLRNTIVQLTTEGGSPYIYNECRARLMEDPTIRSLLPDYIRYSNDADSLRTALSAIASGAGSWARRRGYVQETFKPVLSFLETGGGAADLAITDALEEYDGPAVQAAWSKALERRHTDPEAAITAARTLLEEVCKHVIEDSKKDWDEKWDLPKLYMEAAQTLNLAPSQHNEVVFKTILGNCQSVVQSLGTLRNKLSDAHAGGRRRVRPQARHAALAVNLAGSMALFLVETSKAMAEEKHG